MVTASELIEELQAMGSIEAEVVERGDLDPCFGGVNLDYNEDTGEVVIEGGYFRYAQDSCTRGIDPGRSEATVCGVTFSKRILDEDWDEIEIDGDIEYDEEDELTEDDVLEAAAEVIDFPSYDTDSFPFDIASVDENEIVESIDEQLPPEGVFLQRFDGRVLCMDGCEVISRDRALKLLLEQAKEVDYDAE